MEGTKRLYREWAVAKAECFLWLPFGDHKDALEQIWAQAPGDAAEGLGALCEIMSEWDGEQLREKAGHVRNTLAHVSWMLEYAADHFGVTP